MAEVDMGVKIATVDEKAAAISKLLKIKAKVNIIANKLRLQLSGIPSDSVIKSARNFLTALERYRALVKEAEAAADGAGMKYFARKPFRKEFKRIDKLITISEKKIEKINKVAALVQEAGEKFSELSKKYASLSIKIDKVGKKSGSVHLNELKGLANSAMNSATAANNYVRTRQFALSEQAIEALKTFRTDVDKASEVDDPGVKNVKGYAEHFVDAIMYAIDAMEEAISAGKFKKDKTAPLIIREMKRASPGEAASA